MTARPKSMKALVAYGKDDYRFESEYPVPQVGDEDLLIKIEMCGLCAGDVKAWHGAQMFWGVGGKEPWAKVPFIPGHEFVGRVVEVGPKYSGNIKLNDRVVAEQIVPCGECRFCKTGKYWMCQKHDVLGFQYYMNGGMAEYMILPKKAIVYTVSDDLDVNKVILTEPYSCAYHGVQRANIQNEDVVVISGAGPLGLGMVGAARQKNPKCLITLDLKEDRLKKAKEFGADIVINPAKEDFQKRILELTDGYGCDVYIEVTGFPASVIQGLKAIRKLGTFVEFSVFGSETTVDWTIIGDTKELNIHGSHLSPYCFETVLEWIGNGKLPTEGVVTHQYSLKDWEKAFKRNEEGDGSLKVVLIP